MINNNYLFIDTETTGMDPKLDSIIQLSGFLRINGKEVETFNWKIRPYHINPISLEATKVHGISNEEAQNFPGAGVAFKEFREMLEKYNIGGKNKVFIVGYNIQFDINMLYGLFDTFGGFNLWNYAYTPGVDVMQMALIPLSRFRDKMRNFKLEYIYNFLFNESFKAHDAMADIRSTERIFDFVNDTFLNGYYQGTHPEFDEGQLQLFDSDNLEEVV